jgi:hypothetical protein
VTLRASRPVPGPLPMMGEWLRFGIEPSALRPLGNPTLRQVGE